jgi:hypothetical protein
MKQASELNQGTDETLQTSRVNGNTNGRLPPVDLLPQLRYKADYQWPDYAKSIRDGRGHEKDNGWAM